ncbi:hypothetical protein [Paenibacillus sp. R14(2021)]|uniref:hypothetical protein n=1 Tax=Paenibacillus sp. R14(2021) TaxID=2859228 RepID=UPI001C612AA3|nr:hypothetical protein [Paenibacillus sp. R14(2021)]
MKTLPLLTRILLIPVILCLMLLVPIAFAFNDSGESALTIILMYGGMLLAGIALFVANEIVIRRKALRYSAIRIMYLCIWGVIALVGVYMLSRGLL